MVTEKRSRAEGYVYDPALGTGAPFVCVVIDPGEAKPIVSLHQSRAEAERGGSRDP